jgi:DNA-binding MarR family transcriptional regulator
MNSFPFYDPVLLSLRFALEPIDNILNSLSLLNQTEDLIGLNAWVIRTAASLTQQQRDLNRLIFQWLRDSLTPAPDVSDFSAYLQDLAERDPSQAVAEMERRIDAYDGSYHPDPELQVEMDALRNDAPATWRRIVSHLETLWETSLAAEWERVQPSLIWQVEMFAHHLGSLPRSSLLRGAETAHGSHAISDADDEVPGYPADAETALTLAITRRVRFKLIEEVLQDFTGRQILSDGIGYVVHEDDPGLDGITEVVFVPSWHTGQTVIARQKEGASIELFFSVPPNYDLTAQNSAPMSSKELQARLTTLSNETNIRLLEHLARYDEMSAQEMSEALQISPSLVAQQVKQMASLGYLYERGVPGDQNTYRLSSFYVARTTRALTEVASSQPGEIWTSTRSGEYFYETLPEDLNRFLDSEGRLAFWPPARRRESLLLLEYLAGFFERGRLYSEKEVNELLLLHSAYDDTATLRRALYQYRFLERAPDGSHYWHTQRHETNVVQESKRLDEYYPNGPGLGVLSITATTMSNRAIQLIQAQGGLVTYHPGEQNNDKRERYPRPSFYSLRFPRGTRQIFENKTPFGSFPQRFVLPDGTQLRLVDNQSASEMDIVDE